MANHSALSRPACRPATAAPRGGAIHHVQPHIRPELRHCGESLEWAGDAQQACETAETDTRCLLDPAAQKMLSCEARQLEADGMFSRSEIGSRYRSEERRVGKECRSRWA